MQPYISKHDEPLSPPPTARELFKTYPVKEVGIGNISHWLKAGWSDLVHSPGASLFYGAVFAIIGISLSFIAEANPLFVAACTTGFLLVGPFLAVGIYDLSRRIEHHESPTLGHSMRAVERNAFNLGVYAMALGMLMMAWVRSSALAVAIFFRADADTISSYGFADFVGSILAMENGFWMVLGFTIVGLLFAALSFVTGVVTAQLLVHKEVDIVTAGATSLKAVMKNPLPMLAWAATITVVMVVGIATYYVGLIVLFPLLAHASWHAYRDLVATDSPTKPDTIRVSEEKI